MVINIKEMNGKSEGSYLIYKKHLKIKKELSGGNKFEKRSSYPICYCFPCHDVNIWFYAYDSANGE